jgi:mono/diheme cytochrome c family protein
MPSRAVRLLVIACACLGLTFGVAACGGNDDSDSITLTKLPANPQNGSTPGKPDTGGLGSESAGGDDAAAGGEAAAGDDATAGDDAAGGDDAAAGGGASTANAAGREIFVQSCAGCHTLAEAGASGSVGPNLDDLKPDEATVARMVRAGGGGMPSFDGTLAPEQIDEVAAYVAGAAGS